jgi:hypothetical protein
MITVVSWNIEHQWGSYNKYDKDAIKSGVTAGVPIRISAKSTNCLFSDGVHYTDYKSTEQYFPVPTCKPTKIVYSNGDR